MAELAGSHWLLGEPSAAGPALQLLIPPRLEVLLVEELLHLGVPLGEGEPLLGEFPDLDAVKSLEVWAVSVERSQVDDAQSRPMEDPVVRLALLEGAAVAGLPGPRHLQPHIPAEEVKPCQVSEELPQVLHQEKQTEGAGSRDDHLISRKSRINHSPLSHLFNAIISKDFGIILLGRSNDGQPQGRSLGSSHNILQCAVEIIAET